MRRYDLRFFRTLWLIPLLLLPGAGESQTTSAAWQELLSEFARSLSADVQEDGVGGISAGVVVAGDLVWAQGFGWADTGERRPAGVNTVYRIGSISKSVTAVSLLRLVEGGFLRLDDPVAAVLPELSQLSGRPQGAEPITYRHLASHTAGLIREPELRGAADGPLEFWEEKILASIPATGFFAPPGETYRYSNIGFGILGYSLSRNTGIPFMELVEGAIFRPLGMSSSGFVVTPAIGEQLATGYRVRRDGTVDAGGPYEEHVGRGYKIPNGGVYSTVPDMARLVAGLTGSASAPILGPESRRLIRTSQTPEGDTPYSFGFRIHRRDGFPDLVGHGGSVAGYNAHLVFEPDTGIGVILLRNYGGGATNLGSAARELAWRLLEARVTESEGIGSSMP